MNQTFKINSKYTSFEKQLRERFNEGFDLIQVILGPRQVGKTTAILNLLNEYDGVSHYVSAEESLVVHQGWLDEVWQVAINKSPNCLLVIDEIQKAPNWSERLKYLWDAQKLKKNQQLRVVLLGSSSLKIQKGLSESLTGRYELLRAFHWSLEDSQIIKKLSLEDYLFFGGYPGSYKYISQPKRFDTYLQSSIISSVIEKDLLNESRIKNPGHFVSSEGNKAQSPTYDIGITVFVYHY